MIAAITLALLVLEVGQSAAPQPRRLDVGLTKKPLVLPDVAPTLFDNGATHSHRGDTNPGARPLGQLNDHRGHDTLKLALQAQSSAAGAWQPPWKQYLETRVRRSDVAVPAPAKDGTMPTLNASLAPSSEYLAKFDEEGATIRSLIDYSSRTSPLDSVGCPESPQAGAGRSAWSPAKTQAAIQCLQGKMIWVLGSSVSRQWAFELDALLVGGAVKADNVQKAKCGRGGKHKGARPDGGGKHCAPNCACDFEGTAQVLGEGGGI